MDDFSASVSVTIAFYEHADNAQRLLACQTWVSTHRHRRERRSRMNVHVKESPRGQHTSRDPSSSMSEGFNGFISQNHRQHSTLIQQLAIQPGHSGVMSVSVAFPAQVTLEHDEIKVCVRRRRKHIFVYDSDELPRTTPLTASISWHYPLIGGTIH